MWEPARWPQFQSLSFIFAIKNASNIYYKGMITYVKWKVNCESYFLYCKIYFFVKKERSKNFSQCILAYSCSGAETGQASAQAPHSMQASAITYLPSAFLYLRVEIRHLRLHFSQLYSGFFSIFNEFFDMCISDIR